MIYTGEEVLSYLHAEAELLEPGLPLMCLMGALLLEQLVDGATGLSPKPISPKASVVEVVR